MTNLNLVDPIDQTKPHASVDRETYGFASSREIADAFAAMGWTQADRQTSKPRRADKIGFQKHLVAFENPAMPEIEGLSTENASRVRLYLLNSHDGTGALRILVGAFRFACLNGLIAGPAFKEFRAIHSKNIVNRLKDGIGYVTDGIPELISAVQSLQAKTFEAKALDEFVKSLVDARLSNVGNVRSVDYSSALVVRRSNDAGSDAFTLANRVQEAVIRGGIRYEYERFTYDDSGNVTGSQLVNTRTKALRSITSQVSLNRKVWDEALKLAS